MTERAGGSDHRGVYPILYAFFGEGGGLDAGAMRAQVRSCLSQRLHGIAVLGLATEVEKLSFAEKEAIIALAAGEIDGSVPLVVTIAGASAEERSRLIACACDHGASWLILQPPPETERTENALIAAFSAMMADISRRDSRCLSAIQHAPQYLGVDMSNASFMRLRDEHAHFRLIKGEGSALETAALLDQTDRRFGVFAGRGGLEWPDMLRAGAAGLIPAPETLDIHVAIWEAAQRGDWALADRIYRDALPLLTFIMQSLAALRCYGKRLAAVRMGLGEVYDRGPALAPTKLGETMLANWSRSLPPLAARLS